MGTVSFHVWVFVSRFGLDRPSRDRPSPGPPFPWTALPLVRPSPGPALPLDRPKFRSFFTLSRRTIRSFLPSLGVFSLNFGGVFEGRDPQMCTFGLSGCRVKPRRPHQTGPPGLAHDSPRTPNVHISGHLRFKTPPKFHTLRAPTLRASTLRAPTFSGFGHPPFGAPTLRAPHPSGPLGLAPGLHFKKKTNN